MAGQVPNLHFCTDHWEECAVTMSEITRSSFSETTASLNLAGCSIDYTYRSAWLSINVSRKMDIFLF